MFKYTMSERIIMASLFVVMYLSIAIIGYRVETAEKNRIDYACEEVRLSTEVMPKAKLAALVRYHEREANIGTESSKIFLQCLEGYHD